MIVTCPNCSTRYTLPPMALSDAPRRVRCTKCGNVWSQTAATAEPDPKPKPKPKPKPGKAKPEKAAKDAKGAKGTKGMKKAGAAPPPPPPPPPSFAFPESTGFDDPVDTALPDHNDGIDDLFGAAMRDLVAEPRSSRDSDADLEHDLGFGRDFGMEEAPAGRFAALRAKLSHAGRWIGFGSVILGAFLSLLIARAEIVYLWPPAALFYEVVGMPVEPPGAGLQLQNVKSEQKNEDGALALVVDGQISNISDIERDVPPVIAISIGPDRKVVRKWRIPVKQTKLEPGGTVTFHSVEHDPGVVSELAVNLGGS